MTQKIENGQPQSQLGVGSGMLRVARANVDGADDDDNIVAELERELIVFYDERGETNKARGVRQLLDEHPAEHIAVSLSQKYGVSALPPSWAMVAQIAAPPPVSHKVPIVRNALFVCAALLALYAWVRLRGLHAN